VERRHYRGKGIRNRLAAKNGKVHITSSPREQAKKTCEYLIAVRKGLYAQRKREGEGDTGLHRREATSLAPGSKKGRADTAKEKESLFGGRRIMRKRKEKQNTPRK